MIVVLLISIQVEIWLLMSWTYLVNQWGTSQHWRAFLRNHIYNMEFWISMVLATAAYQEWRKNVSRLILSMKASSCVSKVNFNRYWQYVTHLKFAHSNMRGALNILITLLCWFMCRWLVNNIDHFLRTWIIMQWQLCLLKHVKNSQRFVTCLVMNYYWSLVFYKFSQWKR